MSGRTSSQQSALPPRALNVAAGGTAPEWIELIPAGATLQGVDGRSWANPDPAAVVAATDLSHRALALDWEHAGELRAPQGLDAPAAGWIEALEVREGAIWGRTSWTPRAAEQVANREYRFVSPVFTFAKASSRIERLVSAGLTNAPNLRLTALNHEQESTDVDLITRLRQALSLPADANEDAVVTAVTTARAANVDLTRYAPRSELETAINRANALQADVDRHNAEALTAKIDTVLDKAQGEGKITPASRPEYLAMCKVDGGLERFERLAATLPKIASADRTGTERKPAGGGDNPAALTEEQRAVCRALGQDEAAYAKSLKDPA